MVSRLALPESLRSVSLLSTKLPKMMVHVEVGVTHALGPRHSTKKRVRSRLDFPGTKALKQNPELLQIG
jgi:hypothetical protein